MDFEMGTKLAKTKTKRFEADLFPSLQDNRKDGRTRRGTEEKAKE